MIRHFFKIALRIIGTQLRFSAINIAGLTLGFTAALLIGLFIWDELKYDSDIPNVDRIYRVYNVSTRPEGVVNFAATPPLYAPLIKSEFSSVEQTSRVYQLEGTSLFEANNKKYYEGGGLLVDPAFLDIFSFVYKYGTGVPSAADDGTTIIISQDLCEKYFGSDNPVGKIIVVDKEPRKVKAVFSNAKMKFHLSFNYMLPTTYSTWNKERMSSWLWQQFYTYVKIKDDASLKSIQSHLQQLIRKHAHPATKDAGFTYLPEFQSLSDVYLKSADFKFDIALKGNSTYVTALSVIAILIIVLACFNFVNLATARSLKRAKEVGVRKSVGANRSQLFLQFTGETIIYSTLSLILSLTLAALSLPVMNRFLEKDIDTAIFSDPYFLIILFGASVLVGTAAGFYPAMVMSAYKPQKVLKAGIADQVIPGKIHWLRHGMVVFQFTLCSILLLSAIIVYKQVDYLHNKDLGFNKEQLMFFPMRGDKMFGNSQAFKDELLKSPAIKNVTIGFGFPGDIVSGDEIKVTKDGQLKTFPARQIMVDHDYINTLGLKVVAGREFSRDMKTDASNAFMINETAVRELGFKNPEDAIGKELVWNVWGAPNKDSVKRGPVIGVVKDFHHERLFDKVTTVVLQIFPQVYWKVAVKLETGKAKQAIAHVQSVWNRYSPEFPIEYNFLERNFERMYNSEDKLRTLLGIFTCIAVFIGCLGLLGLTAFAAESRRKEVTIRKVLGASVHQLLFLVSKEFLILVVIALLIGCPIAWLVMQQWLENFPYRVHINGWLVVATAFVSLSIALITVTLQALGPATSNPVRHLKTE